MTMYQRQFDVSADSFATTDASSGYKYPILLAEGYIWTIDTFFVQAQTNYAAADTNYQTFTLADSSGNAIASVANGPATGGLAIGPAVVTGTDESMTAAYQDIDCTDGAGTVYVYTAATGAGLAMLGIKFTVLATPKRKGLADLS